VFRRERIAYTAQRRHAPHSKPRVAAARDTGWI